MPGLREKARKSLQAPEAEAEENGAPTVVRFDAQLAELEASAKAREEELQKEIDDLRKLSEAKTAQIVKQENALTAAQQKLKDLEEENSDLAEDTKKAQKALEQLREQLAEAHVELETLQRTKEAAVDTKAAAKLAKVITRWTPRRAVRGTNASTSTPMTAAPKTTSIGAS